MHAIPCDVVLSSQLGTLFCVFGVTLCTCVWVWVASKPGWRAFHNCCFAFTKDGGWLWALRANVSTTRRKHSSSARSEVEGEGGLGWSPAVMGTHPPWQIISPLRALRENFLICGLGGTWPKPPLSLSLPSLNNSIRLLIPWGPVCICSTHKHIRTNADLRLSLVGGSFGRK